MIFILDNLNNERYKLFSERFLPYNCCCQFLQRSVVHVVRNLFLQNGTRQEKLKRTMMAQNRLEELQFLCQKCEPQKILYLLICVVST